MDLTPPVIVQIDIPVTRRTKIHAVTNGKGVQVYHSRSFFDVLDFLIEHDVGTIEILDDARSFVIKLSRPLASTRT